MCHVPLSAQINADELAEKPTNVSVFGVSLVGACLPECINYQSLVAWAAAPSRSASPARKTNMSYAMHMRLGPKVQ